MDELTIKVPAPFAGVSDLGFTARYPTQEPYSPAADVPLVIEGPPDPMRKLLERLRMLRSGNARSAYLWTDPVMLSDEVVVMAFRDRSLEGATLADGHVRASEYIANWVRPVVFPFLEDCAKVAGLRLAELIEIRVQASQRQIAELHLRLEQIVQPNGQDVLWSP